MAIIDKILNRNSQHNRQEQLQRRLQQMPQLRQSELIELVASVDEDRNLRIEALMLLDFGDELCRWAFLEDNPSLNRGACQRIADLLETNSVSIEQLKRTLTRDQQMTVAGLISNEEVIETLLAEMNDQAQLLTLAKDNPSARIRSWAAEKITDEAAQQELLRTSKGKDKAVYKLMKARLDAQHEQQRQAQAAAEKINELKAGIDKHSHSTVDPLFKAKRDHLWQQWQHVVDQAGAEDIDFVNERLARCDELLLAQQETESTVAAEETATESPPGPQLDQEQLAKQRQGLIDGLKRVLTLLVEESDNLDQSQAELNCANIDNLWQDLEQQTPSPDTLRHQYQLLEKTIAQELNNIRSVGSLEQHLQTLSAAEIPLDSHGIALQEKTISQFKRRLQALLAANVAVQQLQSVNQAFGEWQQQRKTFLEQHQTLVRQITGLIRKSQSALKNGKTGPAQGIRATLRDKCEKLGQLPRHVEKQLQDLDEQLSKVQDWKEYAVLPKKESLVAQMQALINADEPPEALATKIKRLQDEWKLLSRGGFNDDGHLWEQFRSAGDSAFAPCAEYFAEQAKLRQANLDKRQELVGQLENYHQAQDWEHADWKAVAKLVQTAFAEWHSYQPVERAANKHVQKAFEHVIGAIREQLNQEYQRNKEQKKALVDQAGQLESLADNRAAIEQVKQLQSRWKLIGSASHRVDQALWKQFRKHCDQVFEKRKQLNAEFKTELANNQAKASALMAELQQLNQKDLDDLLAARERVDEIRNEFHQLGDLPKDKKSDLQKQWRTASDNFDKAIRREQAKAKASAWDELLSAYHQIRDYSMASARGEDPAQEKTQLEALCEQQTNWPKGGAKALRELLQKIAMSVQNADPQQHRLLCIRAEILAGVDSPKEDNSLRMDYQVKQLAKGFGQAQQQFANGREAMQSLLFEWIETLPDEMEDYSALLARLNQCRQKIGV